MSEQQPSPHSQVGITTFARAPICDDLERLDADVAVLGIPYENTLGLGGARLGPRGIREASGGIKNEIANGYFHPDDNEYYLGPPWKLRDCGDVPIVGSDVEPSFIYVRDYVRKIVRTGALLVGIGGDHAVTTPILEGLDNKGPFGVIHIDAHMDWSETPGRPYCHSKPMRRASEMAHVTAMAQLGVRSFPQTSAKAYQEALDYGSLILSPKKIRELGTNSVLEKIPKCERYYVTIDIDGMDPSIAPATGSTSHGGLLYEEVRELLKGTAGLGEIIGFDLVEVAPDLDIPGKPTCRLACRLIADFLGFILKEKEHRGEMPKR
jgi:agmatinase